MHKTPNFPWLGHWKRAAQRFPLSFWMVGWMGIFAGIGFGAAVGLLFVSKQSACPYLFLPLTSASLRFYCAQEAASEQSVEGLLRAIALLEGLPPQHPRAVEGRQNVEAWGMALLEVAEKEFQLGQLESALDMVAKIPPNLPAARLVEDRVKSWQDRWLQEDEFSDPVEIKLRKSRWNSALIRASRNLNITELQYKEPYGS